jgi:Holliday junction DNA helicase RuvA
MIATLTGNVTEQIDNLIVLDVGGVGYGLWVPLDDYNSLSIGKTSKLYAYEHIREQAYDLYGFCQVSTKELFEQLLSVNGVGPKMALAILSIGSIDSVRQAIAGGQTKLLQSASGVGKKVAERVIVDLKDKVGLIASPDATGFLVDMQANSLDEAQSALVTLGYSPQDAAIALDGVDINLSTEDRIRQALRAKK